MKRLIGLFLFLALPASLFADDAADVTKELKALEGKWKAVSFEAGGKPLPKESVPEFFFIVGADGKCTTKTSVSEDPTKLSVNPKKSPKSVENTHEDGALKGKKQYGIYKLDGDKWTVCMTRPGVEETERPKSFDTKDTANVTFVFERVK